MIGPRVGVKCGAMGGVRVGVGADEIAPQSSSMAGVTKDATSGIYAPATAAEWTTALNAAGIATGGPSFLYLMQAAASPVPEVINGVASLATSGSAGAFAQSYSGWTRVGWKATDGLVGRLLTTDVSLPDPTTTSAMAIGYVAITATPAAQREVMSCIGSTTVIKAQVSTTPSPVATDGANNATGAATLNTAVKPWVIKYNHTASSTTLYTDADKVSPTFAAGSGKAIAIGEAASATAPMWCGYYALFTGAAAELTDAQVKKLLQTLGWSPTWT